MSQVRCSPNQCHQPDDTSCATLQAKPNSCGVTGNFSSWRLRGPQILHGPQRPGFTVPMLLLAIHSFVVAFFEGISYLLMRDDTFEQKILALALENLAKALFAIQPHGMPYWPFTPLRSRSVPFRVPAAVQNAHVARRCARAK
jgi:hypothetical protein